MRLSSLLAVRPARKAAETPGLFRLNPVRHGADHLVEQPIEFGLLRKRQGVAHGSLPAEKQRLDPVEQFRAAVRQHQGLCALIVRIDVAGDQAARQELRDRTADGILGQAGCQTDVASNQPLGMFERVENHEFRSAQIETLGKLSVDRTGKKVGQEIQIPRWRKRGFMKHEQRQRPEPLDHQQLFIRYHFVPSPLRQCHCQIRLVPKKGSDWNFTYGSNQN